MSNNLKTLLEIWREACQHIEIQESTAGIHKLLARQLPLTHVTIIRIEPEHHLAAVVAVAPLAAMPAEGLRVELTVGETKRLVAWVRKLEIESRDAGETLTGPLASLPIHDTKSQLRLVPLRHGSDTLGVATFAVRSQAAFTAAQEELIADLQEPLSAALANDRRLHELAALREAAEADRRSLLRRLGRTDLTDRIIGADGGLAQVMSRVELVSQSDAPVLLLGETGTGKEVIARTVHERSDRHDGPFIRVNCGAIPSELVDSQLFGHEKGAFTGASEMRRGWFERADGGTLFLDEIGELPPDAQVRFLRVLQDAYVERVGGGDPVRVDVRVIAATHRDLAGMVQSGSFREDLWYRIAVFPILLPPLRDRLGDIPVLAGHFAERAAHRFGLSVVMPTEADFDLLRAYHWPGNIRELGAVIDRAAILGDGRSLELKAALGFASPTVAKVSRLGAAPATFEGITSLDVAMREHIERALAATQGRIDGRGGVADLLEINPHTLRSRMKKLGIDWRSFRP
ncbi:sigma-54 interaction domain-containing protein [Aeoliella sp. SH292]|uniref:sigma-54 interaction domain-containing protein n=1 Tax=Aeoliella sp. SH292 TaxID=3454464 RepID=UPI003F964701